VKDQGAKILSSLSANVASQDEAGIGKTLAGIPDPVGTFYRYGLAKSLFRRKVNLPTTAQEAKP
jgi:F420-non-reducing hydrogenase small subunit